MVREPALRIGVALHRLRSVHSHLPSHFVGTRTHTKSTYGVALGVNGEQGTRRGAGLSNGGACPAKNVDLRTRTTRDKK